MENEKQKFNYRGKYFDSCEEMGRYISEWEKSSLGVKEALAILESLKTHICMNIFFREIKLTNLEFSKHVEDIFRFSMNHLKKMKELNTCQEKESDTSV